MSTPAKEGMASTMQSALTDASLSPQDIDYINAHATATDTGMVRIRSHKVDIWR